MKKRRKGSWTAFITISALIISVTALYIYHAGNQEVKEPKYTPRVEPRNALPETPMLVPQERYGTSSAVPKDRISQARKRVAILIDDIGYDLSPLYELLKIDASLTFAILPHYAHSVDAANILHGAKREILLHLPMEPHTFPDENPGMGALLMSMSDRQIEEEVDKDLDAIPYLSGVNNHMGSKFMEDEAKLYIVFRELKKRNLFFVDSRTTPLSKGPEIAKKVGLRFASRKIFIDNDHDYRTIFQNLTTQIGGEFSHKSEPVIMIGHPHLKTIQALKEAIPVLKARGIDVVPVSALVQ
ncbi:MAG: divergent polysaccharide deacetylase family protein [Syntrophales bacterium]